MTGSSREFPPKGLILDIDGVLYRGDCPMPGLVEFFEIARSRPFVLLTNNSTVSALDCRAKLARMGVQVPAAAILTVSEATGRHLAEKFPSGSRAQVLGSAALQTAVVAAGMTLVPTCGDVVVVGLDVALTYQRLAEAVRSVFAGAGFVATSFDSVLLTEQGIAPGSGAIVAAIRACVEAVPVCVGKPSPSMFQMAARQLGLPAEETLVVGDSLASDIAGGKAVGARTALLLSGISALSGQDQLQPDLVLAGLRELSAFLGRSWRT
jgi:4-nitrophenyl phosphatase